MNRKAFFDAVRRDPFGGTLLPEPVANMTAILDEWDKRGLSDLRWLAYMLATVRGECGAPMAPVAEFGRGKGKPYGALGKHGQRAYGRGYVQLTWDYNYEKADKELGLNGALVSNYDLALRPDIAAAILFGGMIGGWFTGKRLADYFHESTADWINARRIINGTDKAATFAGWGKAFYAALLAAKQAPADSELPAEPPPPVPAPPAPPTPEPAPPPAPAPATGFVAVLLAILKAIFGKR